MCRRDRCREPRSVERRTCQRDRLTLGELQCVPHAPRQGSAPHRLLLRPNSCSLAPRPREKPQDARLPILGTRNTAAHPARLEAPLRGPRGCLESTAGPEETLPAGLPYPKQLPVPRDRTDRRSNQETAVISLPRDSVKKIPGRTPRLREGPRPHG